MTKHEKFDAVFARRGGLYNLGSDKRVAETVGPYLELCETFVDDFIKINLGLALPVPIINVIDNLSFGACATVSENEYFIGINLGTFVLLDNLFIRMCASNGILTEFGEANHEEDAVKIYNPAVYDAQNLLNQIYPGDTLPHPKGAERVGLAVWLTGLGLRHVVMHEYAHIVHGHVDFYRKERGISYFDEVEFLFTKELLHSNAEAINTTVPLTSQTLEFDADVFAITAVMNSVLRMVEINQEYPAFLPFIRNRDEAIYLLCFAIYSTFRLFAILKPSVDDLPYLSHPPFALRQLISFTRIMQNVYPIDKNGQAPDGHESLLNAIMSSSEEVEKAFSDISEGPQDGTAFETVVFDEDYLGHLSKYIQHWAVLRPKLEGYTYRPLPLFVEP